MGKQRQAQWLFFFSEIQSFLHYSTFTLLSNYSYMKNISPYILYCIIYTIDRKRVHIFIWIGISSYLYCCGGFSALQPPTRLFLCTSVYATSHLDENSVFYILMHMHYKYIWLWGSESIVKRSVRL